MKNPTMPSQTLLQGKPYTPAARTDIRELFNRVRLEMAPKGNVKSIRRAK